jgi:CPA2 family monovalent cation:H+ antiporter-2
MEHVLILKDLAVIFTISLVVILAFHRFKLPALPGFIVAGVLVGPNALGLISDVQRVEGLAEVGVILLLFTIGIEFSLDRLREMGRQATVGGGLQMGLTIAVAGAIAAALGQRWEIALFLGCLIALSSTALVLKGLTDQGEIDTPHGRLATGVLIFQDLCVVPIMLVMPFLAGRASGGVAGLALALGKAAAIVLCVVVVARTLVPRLFGEILKTRSRELVLIAIILLGTLTALATAQAGASLALGAFLAGLVISESDYGHQALAELLPFRDVFISLFFVAVGMLVELSFVRDHPVLTLSGIVVVLGGKTLAAAVGPAVLGYAGRVALHAGLLVSQLGEFSFVLAKEGRALGLLQEEMYQGFLAIAVFTMLVTPFLLQSGTQLIAGL